MVCKEQNSKDEAPFVTRVQESSKMSEISFGRQKYHSIRNKIYEVLHIKNQTNREYNPEEFEKIEGISLTEYDKYEHNETG